MRGGSTKANLATARRREVRADLIGWDWELRRGVLVAWPTPDAYIRYVVLLAIPMGILLLLWMAGVTPYHLWTGKIVESHRDPANAADHTVQKLKADFDAMVQQQLQEYERQRGKQAADELRRQIQEKQALREADSKAKRDRMGLVGRFLAIVVGVVFWAPLVFWAGVMAAILLRTPSARYRFTRDTNGWIRVTMPRLFCDRTVEFSVADLKALVLVRLPMRSWWRHGGWHRWDVWAVRVETGAISGGPLPLFCIEQVYPACANPSEPGPRVRRFYEQLTKVLAGGQLSDSRRGPANARGGL